MNYPKARLINILVTIALLSAKSILASWPNNSQNNPNTLTVIDLTLPEKVGQLMMVSFRGEIANHDAQQLIQELYIGGIIYYNWANNLSTLEQIQKLSTGLQQLTLQTRLKIPLLIAADQEGGKVARCPITNFPGNQALGITNHPALARASAYTIGTELLAIGVNTNLAPVVDINSNPQNPVIGSRSFGDTPELITTFGAQALSGYHAAGIITTLKHFPGHGDTSIDSHLDLPVINKTLKELQAVELVPFTQLASQTDMIMTAHILVPALDPEYCTTLSHNTLNYLRNKISFNGVIITDSLIMAGVLKQVDQSITEAAIRALIAGHDIILLGGAQLHGVNITKELTLTDIKQIQQAIIQAVKSGRISETQIDQSVQRILNLKQKYLPATLEIYANANTM
jgi:beta-N-acetylhexosaminidase